MSETYDDLKATLERGATLGLTPEERRNLADTTASVGTAPLEVQPVAWDCWCNEWATNTPVT